MREAVPVATDPPGADPIFAAAAGEFARSVRFEPARKDGEAVAVQFEWVVDLVPPPPPVATPPPATAPGEPMLHSEVEAQRAPPLSSASDFTIVPGKLRLVPRPDAVDLLLTLAPGVHFRR